MPLELDKPLILPNNLRAELKKVHGELVREQELASILAGKFVITVGDVVTFTLLKLGLKPNIAIVDYKTKREKIEFEEIKKFGDVIYAVKNPAGSITPELWNAIKSAIELKKNVRLDVDGEEDLAVIPAVILAPLGAIVIYGIPNTGLVVLEIKEEDKKTAQQIIENMEE